jgi:hypothetical protein
VATRFHQGLQIVTSKTGVCATGDVPSQFLRWFAFDSGGRLAYDLPKMNLELETLVEPAEMQNYLGACGRLFLAP